MLKAYEEYKESMAPFEREIPSHWVEYRLSWLYKLVSDTNHVNEELLSVYLDRGVVNYSSTSKKQVHKPSEDLSKYQLVHPNDFVLNNQQAWRGSVGISGYRGIVSPAYYVWRPRVDLNSKFMNYMVRDKDIVNQFVLASKGVGSIQRQIYVPYMKTVVLAVPSRDEQNQIVCYLDWKISGMNRFIDQKKKEIKLLQELKYTRINQLITKGISKAEMIESNVDWMGKIPSSWDVHCIKQHFRIKKRIAREEGYDVFSITQKGIRIKDVSKNEGQMAQNYANYQFVYPGEFAMNHMDLITGYVDIASSFGVTSPDYRVFILTDTDNYYARYYLRVFQIGYKRRIFYKFGKGAANQGRWRLPKDRFYTYKIPVPSYKEQIMIADKCDKIEKDIDFMIRELEMEIRTIEELKTKIIADVVTGKVDVRNVVVPDYIVEEKMLEECDRMENDEGEDD